MEKACWICKETKPLSEFHRNCKASDGHQGRCKRCAIAAMAEYQKTNRERVNLKNLNWKRANPEKTKITRKEYKRKWRLRVPAEIKSALNRKWALKRMYSLTPEQYDAMLEAQDGVCAICKNPSKDGRRLHVDHDHTTDKNRGLLCSMCNKSVERVEKDPDWGIKAREYLLRFK
jgi:Recombination endonuclease VII